MPFNPDEYLAKKQAETATPSAGAQQAFDPNAYLTTKGVDVLPNQGNIQDGSTAADAFKGALFGAADSGQKESIGLGAAQGATLKFGDELSAGVGALASTGTDEALNRGYLDRYANIRDTLRANNKQAEANNPGLYALSDIAGTIPLAIASAGAGMIGRAKTAGQLAALTSVGASENQSLPSALDRAAKSGATGAALSVLLEGGLKLVQGAVKSALKYPSAAFKSSYELEQSLKDPAVATQIGQQIQETGDKLVQVAQQAKSKVGQGLDTLASKVETPVSGNDTIETIHNKLAKYSPTRNAEAVNTKNDFSEFLTKVSEDLKGAEGPDGKVPFQFLHKVKQEIRQVIFDQGMFSKDPYTNKLAGEFYNGIAKTLKTADKTGAYNDLSKVYSLLSNSDPEAFTPSAIKYLNDPFDANSMNRLTKLTGKLSTLDPTLQQAYIPELTSFINKDLTNAAFKTELLKHVGGKSGILALRGLNLLPAPSGAAADLGASMSQYKGSLNPLIDTARAGAQALKPLAPGVAATGISRIASSLVPTE